MLKSSSLRARYSSYRSLGSRTEPSQPLLAATPSENPFEISPYPSSSSTAVASFPFPSRTTTSCTARTGEEGKPRSLSIQKIVVKVVHPRRSRSLRKAKKVETRKKEEEERVKEIEEFLESGRAGPRRYP